MSTRGEVGLVPPLTVANAPNARQVVPVRVAEARCSRRVPTPDPASVPGSKLTLTVVSTLVLAAYVTVPPEGPVESLTNVSVVWAVLPATSRPVTTSVGALVAPAVQLKEFETYGPPAGVDTVDGVWLQPVVAPPRAAVALDADPDPASLTALVSVKEPAAAPL